MAEDLIVAVIRLHGDIAQAVKAGDPAAAEQAMREIITEAATAMLPTA